MKAIVITFDRLALRMLGCYGNEWVATPHFDRLAAASVVFEQHLAENLDPAAESHAWWTGCYQFPTTPARRGPEANVLHGLRQAGIATHLLIEAGTRVPDGVRTAFETATEIDGYDGLDVEDEETPFARLVESAIEQLDELGSGRNDSWLLWLKSRGVPRPWLPPRAWATRFLDLVDEAGDGQPGEVDADDEGTDEPEVSAEPEPVVDLSPEEFDTLLGAVAAFGESPEAAADATDTEWRLSRQVYAGYVAHLDDWLGQLLEEVDRQLAGEDLLVIVTAAEGESLAERAGLPNDGAVLAEERLHTPLLMRLGNRAGIGRRQELTQTVDLGPTLLDWFQTFSAVHPVEGRSWLAVLRGEVAGRDAAVMGTEDGGQGIRTPEWFCRRESGNLAGWQLFVKPDDLWEIHDVAGQSPEEAERLSAALLAYIKAACERVSAQPPQVIWGAVEDR